MKELSHPKVAAVFKSYPKDIRVKLMFLRQLIFDVASKTEWVGELEETLKWGQPSFVTTKSKSGSTIRIDQVKAQKGKYALYVHCQTTLMETFRKIYPDQFHYEGNRSMIFDKKKGIPVKELSHCISLALTYHIYKKAKKRV